VKVLPSILHVDFHLNMDSHNRNHRTASSTI